MKNKLKYLFTAILVLVFAFCFSVSASADGVEDGTNTEDTAANVFETVYAEISAYSGEILCALTFVGSVVLAIAYKKGLLPIVKGSLLTISNTVSKMKESASETAQRGIELGKYIEDSLGYTKEAIESLAERVHALDVAIGEKLASESEMRKEKEALRLILASQIDMLYDVFMSAALPQYQKDMIGERYANMKGALGTNAVKE